MMRAILIETDKKRIREVDDFDGTLGYMYKILECSLVESVYLSHGDILFVDEEGLLRSSTIAKGFFRWLAYPQDLSGRGIIVGGGDGEELDAPAMSIDTANRMVAFLT
jgi:hypothetical protein